MKKTFDCACGRLEHTARFTYFPEDNGPDELYIETTLANHNPIYKRLWFGIKYILGVKPDREDFFDCTLLVDKNIDELINVLTRWREEKPEKKFDQDYIYPS